MIIRQHGQEPKKPSRTAKFDSAKIFVWAEKSIGVEDLATATGYEQDGSFKRRVKGRVRSGGIVERANEKV